MPLTGIALPVSIVKGIAYARFMSMPHARFLKQSKAPLVHDFDRSTDTLVPFAALYRV
jgi:hypothetical protein